MATNTVASVLTVGTSSIQLVGASGARKALVIGPPNGGRVTFWTGGPAVLDSGLTLQTGDAPIMISEALYY